MECSRLPEYLDGDLTGDVRAQFERHLVTCAACQGELEAAMQMMVLGGELSRRPDRPQAVRYLPNIAERREARRPWHRPVAATALAAAAAVALAVWWSNRTSPTPGGALAVVDDRLAAGLAPRRSMFERLPYAALDHHREYDTMRSGPAHPGRPPIDRVATGGGRGGEVIAFEVMAGLEKRADRTALIAALIAQGDFSTAETRLRQAGPGDGLDIERAIVAEHTGQTTVALALLDQVIARSPRNAQALWNRAVVLTDLDLPLTAAEAFDACAALGEPGWSTEARTRADELRRRETERAGQLKAAVAACAKISDGVIPDLELVRRHAAECRPSLYVATRLATSRDQVLRLLPVARVLDEVAGNTAGAALVNRIAAADFRARGPSVALYARLRATPKPPLPEQARIVEQLRASGHGDLLLGALIRVDLPLVGYIDELARLAHAAHDPYLDEIAIGYAAIAKRASGKVLEAEADLRQAVAQCAARDVELRCTYLELTLAELYVARHRPTEATETALAALARAKRVGVYWSESDLYSVLGQAAQLQRDYSQMRVYIREPALRVDDCPQVRLDQEALAGAELSELRFAVARAELDRAPTCDQRITVTRARIEAELARFDGTPARTARLVRDLVAARREPERSRGESAYLDAIEGRALAETDPAAARAALDRAIAAADALGADDVDATKARNLAYRAVLVQDARGADPAALLARFAAASRARPRDGCALGALVDGERLLLLARDPAGRLHPVFEPHAFKTPDFDPRSLVPAALVAALAACARVDVFALAPLYGQPRLLPPELAWSYRGPAGAAAPAAQRPTTLAIEDVRPPAALELPRLQSSSHPRDLDVEAVTLRGLEATPDRVRRELVRADFAEIHAHGFVDLGVSDVSLIALSPGADGSFALTARVIAGLRLPRAPFVTLAACDAAYTAPYLHEPWSLPYAFLLAGARGVLAPATKIPDSDAASFFRAVGDQILRGVDPALVLRDQRQQRRGDAGDWVNDVVLFD